MHPVSTDPIGSKGCDDILAELASIIRSVIGADAAPDQPLMQVQADAGPSLNINDWASYDKPALPLGTLSFCNALLDSFAGPHISGHALPFL